MSFKENEVKKLRQEKNALLRDKKSVRSQQLNTKVGVVVDRVQSVLK